MDFQINSTNVRINKYRSRFLFLLFSLLWMINQKAVKRFIIKNFFRPKLYRPGAQEKRLLAEGTPFTVTVNEQAVTGWRWGDGPAIILAHGWNGSGIQFTAFIREALRQGYSAVAFDGPGHGQSEGKTSSYFEMTDAVRAVMAFCRPNPVAGLIGHSFGAGAIINAQHKEKSDLPAVLIAPVLNIREILEDLFTLHGLPPHIYHNLVRMYETRFGYDLETDNPRNLLNALHPRTLIIHDRDDKVAPYAASEQAAQKYDNISLFPVSGLGHKKLLGDANVVAHTFEFLIP